MSDPNYTKVVNGESVPMSAAEIAERQAEEAAWEAAAPARARAEAMGQVARTDGVTGARGFENLVTLLIDKGLLARDEIEPHDLARINARRKLRGDADL